MMTIGSLFSGIGGLELGLERAGVGRVVWQCELDPFCRSVLAKHWPNVTRFHDVSRPRDWPAVDLICGGFPCQDVSAAGRRGTTMTAEQWSEAWPMGAAFISGAWCWAMTIGRYLTDRAWKRGYDEGRADQQALERSWPVEPARILCAEKSCNERVYIRGARCSWCVARRLAEGDGT